MYRYRRALLLATVFTTGASVLIVEVAAVRLLSPYFGASLYVLSSVLTVILFALALGYYVGGKLSDHRVTYRILYGIITAGGLALLSLIVLAQFGLPALAPGTSLLFGPLIFSLSLFFLPAFLLGIDSPYVIRLLTNETDATAHGAAVGATFFWSTTGSIVGSLISGFLLIPFLGLTETFLLTGAVLVLLGIIGLTLTHTPFFNASWHFGVPHKRSFLLVLAAGVFFATLLYASHVYTPHADAIYRDDGYYSQIHIYDTPYRGGTARVLRRDTNSSAAIFLDRDTPVFPYIQFMQMYQHVHPEPNAVLALGGGAYTVPRMVLHDTEETSIDVVEIEPSLFELAERYFDLPESERVKNHVADARAHLLRSESVYGVIFVDVFSAGTFIPPHLVTTEFFTLVAEHLTDDGIAVVNFIGAIPREDERTMTGSFTKTVTEVFPGVAIYAMEGADASGTQNIMYVLSNSDEPIIPPARFRVTDHQTITPVDELRVMPEALMHEDDRPFTDNDSAVEWLLFKERAL